MIDLSKAGLSFGPVTKDYDWRDVVLFHLGVGFQPDELDFVYERAKRGLQVIPSYAVVAFYSIVSDLLRELNIELKSVLHGEHAISLKSPIPAEGKFLTTARIAGIYDKRRAALIVIEAETATEAGRVLFSNTASLFCRGLGGWGGDPGPQTQSYPVPADRPPDFDIPMQTGNGQAALFRLSGDVNPLHIDPEAAKAAGFPEPILHGLCTFGFATRAILRGACQNDVSRLKSFRARFSNVVFPGETLTTQGWRMEGGVYHLRTATARGEVLSHGCARVEE